MKRTHIKSFFTSLFVLVFSTQLLAFSSATNAATAEAPAASVQKTAPAVAVTKTSYKEGVHYHKIETPLKVSTGNKIEVRELFWYGCPHCFFLETFVNNWKKSKPDNAEFIATPAVFSARWAFHAKAFYATRALGIQEQAHDIIFSAIHKEKKQINNVDSLAALLQARLGTDPEKVKNAMQSFAVDSNMRAANAISVKSNASGVPTILVDGKYRASVQSAGSETELFNVVNFLVKKSAAER